MMRLFPILFLSCAAAFSPIPRFYGEWMLWHSTLPDVPNNRAVVHIYPENDIVLSYRFCKGPLVYHKVKTGRYDMPTQHDEGNMRIGVSFHDTEEHLISVYGIGLQNLNIRTMKKDNMSHYDLSMVLVGMDDIYLQTVAVVPKHHHSFHLVRSVRMIEPNIEIPISSFIFTQIVSTVLGHVIHLLLFHSDNN